ncbi:hypothetical protein N431DRAFT_475187 [Stipitochalara longipes BDJ]|nr:hypothetical protein N431DRAFT_475187 [Stipitochalara longipes BDJ]
MSSEASPSNLSLKDAQKLIEEIAHGHRRLSEDALEKVPKDLVKDVMEALQALNQNIHTPLHVLAKSLYSHFRGRAQFAVELIRNADDNRYTRAALANAVPYIRFDIHPGEIVVETNEDGFTAADVNAICQIGHSIGFKYVFAVSSKVYINSGLFSFFFKHEPGDPGLGMITPVYCEHEEILKESLTRIKLTLLERLDREDLENQFHHLPGTILLFLENLQSITIDEYDGAATLSQSVTYSCDSEKK